jgi:5,10-methylenetetrahydromethanopterin reductase
MRSKTRCFRKSIGGPLQHLLHCFGWHNYLSDLEGIMRLGFSCAMAKNGICTIDEYIHEVQSAETMGFDQAWMAQVFSTDAISLLWRETATIRLGTAVTPSYPRHPTSMALQVLTASAASHGRFDLGLGVSHKAVTEDRFGIPYVKPAMHMREYLEVLMPLVNGEPANFEGEEFNVHTKMNVPGAESVPVLLAALGTKMLEIAGTMADGASTWMVGPRTLAAHTVPSIRKAAEQAGRSAPRVVAGVPIVLTNDPEAAQSILAKKMSAYRHIPSYSKMLDREGVESPAELALVGDEAELRGKLAQLKSIGVTDLIAFCMPVDEGAIERTMAFIASEKSTLKD